jgi:hypothetical protein
MGGAQLARWWWRARPNLPDVGIYGNGHNYMMQNNADEIVEKVYLPWLKENVK